MARLNIKKLTGAIRRLILPLAIIGIAVLVFVLLVKTKPDAKPIEKQEKAWTVSAVAVEPVSAAPTLALYGKVDSLWSSSLTAAVAAEVRAVEVIEGDSVAQGALLLMLDDSDAQLDLTQKEADVREAEAILAAQESRHQADLKNLPKEQKLLELTRNEVSRLEGLVKKQVSSQSTLDTARQNVKRQEISVTKIQQSISEHDSKMAEYSARLARSSALKDKAQLSLDRTRIKAPYNARVAKILVSPGQRVRVGDALLEVYDTDAMIFRAVLPEPYLSAISSARRSGSVLTVKGLLDGEEVRATLLSMAAETSQSGGGVEGLFKLEAVGTELQKGRLTRLDLTLPVQDRLVSLPQEAVYGQDQVYRVNKENRLALLKVERVGESTGPDGISQVLVRSPELQPGDRVLTTQLPSAVEGLLVKVVE